MAIAAVQHMRRMRGGAQSHLMLAADENLYVVKFQNNPQHLRVLTNELIGGRLAMAVGLSVAPCEVIEVCDSLIANTPELHIGLGRSWEICRAGLQFGSRFAGGLMPRLVMDALPEEMLLEITNLRDFAGMLAFDKWTCNTDGRQAVFAKKWPHLRYRASFIDQGYCFNAGEWKWADSPLRGMFREKIVYREIAGWESFEPWLERIESIAQETIWSIARTVPPEWYEGQWPALEKLMVELIGRQQRVRELITQLRDFNRNLFPKWSKDRGPIRPK